MNNQQFKDWCQLQANSVSPHLPQRPLLMGILNVTPDSFSDGGRYLQLDRAVKHAEQMLQEGADIIDIGGESSKPGALSVSLDEELNRVIPIIERLREISDVCISIDTTKAEVMREAIAAGAGLINDISALKEHSSLTAAVQLQVPVCLMHMQGTPLTMQEAPFYQHNVITEINNFFTSRVEICIAAGLKRDQLILDPGFGFGKTVQHNLQIIKYLEHFKVHHLPIMLGVSRKSTIGTLLNKTADERLIGSIALSTIAALNGASLLRTHDIDETRQALQIALAIRQADNKESKEDKSHGST
ncbi:MAG: dihydropteroate synthase [Legionella sp.]|nr:dihydropteroate synthase [Legionella sp.]